MVLWAFTHESSGLTVILGLGGLNLLLVSIAWDSFLHYHHMYFRLLYGQEDPWAPPDPLGISMPEPRPWPAPASAVLVARGGRPTYRVGIAHDGRWQVDAMPWLPLTAASRREALDATRVAIARWLEVEPDTFDVAAD